MAYHAIARASLVAGETWGSERTGPEQGGGGKPPAQEARAPGGPGRAPSAGAAAEQEGGGGGGEPIGGIPRSEQLTMLSSAISRRCVLNASGIDPDDI